jgi:hypothetical protein
MACCRSVTVCGAVLGRRLRAMTRKDRDALTRALAMAKTLDPAIANAVEAMLRTQSWQEAAECACFHAQVKSLKLRPWQAPPCNSDDAVDAAGTRRRLIALGLSIYEPDPLAAIERTEAEAPQPAA